VILLVLLAGSQALARHVWTDATGDGLPDGSLVALAVGDTARLDLWFDSDSLVWDAYYLYVGWQPGAFLWTDAELRGITGPPVTGRVKGGGHA
jgi:hypothetical protein